MRLNLKVLRILLLGALVGASLMLPLTALAQYPPPTGNLNVGATVAAPGEPVAVSGDGFCPGRVVTVTMEVAGQPPRVLGSFTTNSAGAFSGTVVIPADVNASSVTLRATGLRSDCRTTNRTLTAVLGIRIAAPPPAVAPADTLAVTGIEALPWLAAAVGVIAVGGGALFLGRRRKLVKES